MELLLDLLTLDDALLQRGLSAPADLSRAIDRADERGAGFFTLGDDRLGAFHGGEAGEPARVEAATAHDDAERRVHGYAPHSGYHRLTGRTVQVLVDAAAPPSEGWSIAACGQPAALEIVCGPDRLIVNSGWSPNALGPQAMRLAAAASTLTLGEASAGAPLSGFRARVLGPRLIGGASRVDARRDENETGVWLELTHDGWAPTFGLLHERKLFLDLAHDELRGEDRLCPATTAAEPRRKLDPYAIRFHLAPEVKVSLARDQRSALLRGPSNKGWWLRNDAPEVALEPSVRFEQGQPRRTMQDRVCAGNVGLDGEARVRWKLTPVDPCRPAAAARPARPRDIDAMSAALHRRDRWTPRLIYLHDLVWAAVVMMIWLTLRYHFETKPFPPKGCCCAPPLVFVGDLRRGVPDFPAPARGLALYGAARSRADRPGGDRRHPPARARPVPDGPAGGLSPARAPCSSSPS